MLSDFVAKYVIFFIIFQAVMRIRCTRGLSLHTFHGNFFVRSTGKNPKIPVHIPEWGIQGEY